ncbi:hypothetical protein MASR2M47_34930 [Draconibacterium sp.]|jgi:hypothetical protein
MKKILMIAVLIAGFGVNQSNAQFLKELRDRTLEKSKDMVIDKTADKAADKTGEAMDKLLNPDFGNFMNPGGKKVDMSTLPASYNFDYRYAMKMTTEGGAIDFDYYLSKTEPYMGVKMNMGMEMSMVFDEGNKVMFTYVNGMATASEMDLTDALDEEDINMYENYTFKELPNREFLGYDCIGREMENDEHKFTVYIAPDMEAGFGNMFKSEHAKIPPAMQKFAQDYENGLMMYMEMVDKKNKKKKNTSATMECTAFEPSNLVISTRK